MPHSIFHSDACFAYFNKNWGIPDGKLSSDCNFGFSQAGSLGNPDAPGFEG